MQIQVKLTLEQVMEAISELPGDAVDQVERHIQSIKKPRPGAGNPKRIKELMDKAPIYTDEDISRIDEIKRYVNSWQIP